MEKYAEGKWFIHNTTHRKANQSQSQKKPEENPGCAYKPHARWVHGNKFSQRTSEDRNIPVACEVTFQL